MKTSELMDLINDLEARYQVDQWTFDGLHVWPFIRIRLSFDLFHHYHISPDSAVSSPSFAGRARRLVSQNRRFLSASLSDRRMNAWPNRRAETVFFSDGISYAQLDGAWYEKFCDPLRSILDKGGRSTFMISPLHEYLVPRYSPSLFIQPCIDMVKIRNYLLPKPGEASSVLLREHADCCTYLASRGLPATLMDMHTVRTYTRMIEGIAGLYGNLLRRIDPSLVFLVSYYGIEGMAVNLACRRLNLPAVDIQHGFQGDLHIAYARWNRVPASGYELLPSAFWCWAESDVATIRKWSAPLDRWHHPVAGGNVWLSLWQRSGQDIIRRHDAVIEEVIGRRPGARHILVTLQPGLSDQSVLDGLLEAVRRGSPGWRWWFRLHPCMLQDRQRIRDMLQRNAVTGYELDLATDLPLYALLRHLDLHITHSSSTVIEAQQFGIPSVIINEFGIEFFPEQISSGWAVPAYTAEGIRQAIERQLDARERLVRPGTEQQRPPYETVEATVDGFLQHHRQFVHDTGRHRDQKARP